MIVIQFRQDLFHYRFTEKHCLRSDPELVTILPDSRHLAIIQIDNLPMLTHKSLLLLLQILRIDRQFVIFPFLGHLVGVIIFAKVNN